MIPILSGNVASATTSAYEVANSCRFNDGDSPVISRTLSDSEGKKWSFSVWLKRSSIGIANMGIFGAYASGSDYDAIYFDANDQLDWFFYGGSGTMGQLKTNRRFRDVAAWYHLLFVYDSANATAGNRMRLYVNGTEETSFATDTNPSLNAENNFNNNLLHVIGEFGNTGDNIHFDGYMSEVVFLDDVAASPTDFGEFDSDTPSVFKPIDVSGLTFGTNGFYLDFEDSSNLGNDANGGTDWSETNLAATDQSISTPTNNFANYFTDFFSPDVTFSEAGLKVAEASNNWRSAYGNIGVTAGKWYAEFRVNYTSGNEAYFGVADEDHLHGTATFTSGSSTGASGGTYDFIGNSSGSMGIYSGGNYYSRITGSQVNATYAGTAQSNNDIIGIALDMDNNKVYFSKGGVWADGSGSWGSSTFNSSTGALSITSKTNFFAVSPNESVIEANFGDPSFSISSGNADANGYGNFEYPPPSGYLSLCTKNLGSDGG